MAGGKLSGEFRGQLLVRHFHQVVSVQRAGTDDCLAHHANVAAVAAVAVQFGGELSIALVILGPAGP